MSGPWEKYQQPQDEGPWTKFSKPKAEPQKPDYEDILNEGSTLKFGPFDTGIGIGPKTTQFLAGMGKRFSDIGTLGMRDETDADKALMDKGAAMAGGAVADLSTLIGGGSALRGAGMLSNLPKLTRVGRSMVMPGTALEAAGVGGAYSGLTTNGDLGDRVKATGIGAASGAAFPVLGAAYKTGKAMIEPLTKSGQEAIAGRVLRRFAGDSADTVAQQLKAPEIFVKGSIPTAGEAANNAGLATLQNGLANTDKGGFGNALDVAQKSNRAARVSALQDIGKDATAIEAAQTAREAASSPLYDLAKQSMVEADGNLKMLLSRPSIKSAWTRAKELAGEEGKRLVVGENAPAAKTSIGLLDASGKEITRDVPEQFAKYSGEGLHYLKMALDDMIETGPIKGIGGAELKALRSTRENLLNWMDNKIPEYGKARKTYADMSKPIAQMEVGQELVDKLRPALSDFGANTRETAATYAKALRDSEVTARKATGVKGATLENTMTPEQMGVITGVAKDLARKASSDDMARGLGSNTAQNLATQNILRQMFGPLGLPQSFAESTFMQTLAKPMNLIYSGIGEQKIADALGRGLLSPQEAARLMTSKKVTPRPLGLLDSLPAIPAAVIGPQFSQ